MHPIAALTLQRFAYMHDQKYYKDLVGLFTTIREKLTDKKNPVKTTKALKELTSNSGVEKLVFDVNGIKVDFKLGYDYGYNAYVIPPDLDRNHPLLAGRSPEYWAKSSVSKKRLKEATDGILRGSVDIQNHRATGVFSEIPIEIFVAAQFFHDERFQVEEIVSIFLHEVGHAMFYLLYLGRTITLNHVLGDLTSALNDDIPDVEAVEIVKSARKKLDIDDKEPLAEGAVKNKELVKTVIICDYQRQLCSATNTPYHETRTFEALADQFVSRVGGALPLATGLDKMMRMYGDPSYQTLTRHLLGEAIITILGLTILLPFTLLIALIFTFTDDGSLSRLCDPTKLRLSRIRSDMVNQLKSAKIPNELRRRLDDEIKAMDKLIAEAGDEKSGFYDAIIYVVSPAVRRQFAAAKNMQQLEDLANNPLFVSANRLAIS